MFKSTGCFGLKEIKPSVTKRFVLYNVERDQDGWFQAVKFRRFAPISPKCKSFIPISIISLRIFKIEIGKSEGGKERNLIMMSHFYSIVDGVSDCLCIFAVRSASGGSIRSRI